MSHVLPLNWEAQQIIRVIYERFPNLREQLEFNGPDQPSGWALCEQLTFAVVDTSLVDPRYHMPIHDSSIRDWAKKWIRRRNPDVACSDKPDAVLVLTPAA